jgi:hypothetical protein
VRLEGKSNLCEIGILKYLVSYLCMRLSVRLNYHNFTNNLQHYSVKINFCFKNFRPYNNVKTTRKSVESFRSPMWCLHTFAGGHAHTKMLALLPSLLLPIAYLGQGHWEHLHDCAIKGSADTSLKNSVVPLYLKTTQLSQFRYN